MKENSKRTEWVCKAKLDFEEKQPVWGIEKTRAVRLLKVWNSLKTTLNATTTKSAYLGYGGTYIKSSDNSEWHIYNDTVTFRNNNTLETRIDKNRYFEKTILKTAPRGILPDALCNLLFGI